MGVIWRWGWLPSARPFHWLFFFWLSAYRGCLRQPWQPAEGTLLPSNSYLPGRGDTLIMKEVHPGRGSAIALRLC